jgi:hypothetical protein
MSNVRATAPLERLPWDTGVLARGGAGVGVAGDGVGSGRPLRITTPGHTISRQPTSMRLGSKLGWAGSRLGYRSPFQWARLCQVVAYRAAITESESPLTTVYTSAPAVGVGVGPAVAEGRGVGVALAVGDGLRSGDGVGCAVGDVACVGGGTVEVEGGAAGPTQAASTTANTARTPTGPTSRRFIS